METAAAIAENHPEQTAKVVETAGIVFPNGSGLELVSASPDNNPGLLFWENGKPLARASEFERAGRIHRPPNVDASVWLATTLPTDVVDRGPVAELFRESADLFKTYLGMSSAESALLTAWNATTWFADILLNLVTLFIYGPDVIAAMRLLRLLSCIGRHSLILADIDAAAIHQLTKLQPTVLLNQPRMSPRLRGLCSSSNFRGLVVPLPDGAVREAAFSKAIFLGNPAQPLNDPGIHFFLPPSSIACPPLDVGTQLRIKQRFQPWYLSYRLALVQEVHQSQFAGTVSASPTGGIEATLESCTGDDGQLKGEWAPLLRSQEEDALAQSAWDPVAAATEVLWLQLHSSATSFRVKELTAFTNALLRSRGENREYAPEEIGIKLKNQGICRHRRSSGMLLLFDRPTRRRLHEIARSVGVGRRAAGCADCEEMQIATE